MYFPKVEWKFEKKIVHYIPVHFELHINLYRSFCYCTVGYIYFQYIPCNYLYHEAANDFSNTVHFEFRFLIFYVTNSFHNIAIYKRQKIIDFGGGIL